MTTSIENLNYVVYLTKVACIEVYPLSSVAGEDIILEIDD